MKKRKCGDCKIFLGVINFTVDNSRKDGLRIRCKKCDEVRNKKWRENNKEKVREKSYRYMQKYPDRQRARGIVNAAIKSGTLQKKPCEYIRCKKSPVHAHHNDYSKPLEVKWLCVKHHELIHHES